MVTDLCFQAFNTYSSVALHLKSQADNFYKDWRKFTQCSVKSNVRTYENYRVCYFSTLELEAYVHWFNNSRLLIRFEIENALIPNTYKRDGFPSLLTYFLLLMYQRFASICDVGKILFHFFKK